MSEERDLAIKAARAVRAADKRLLVAGMTVALLGAALLVLADPWASDAASIGDYLRRAWAPMLAAVVFIVGFSLIAAALGRFDETGRRRTWYVVVAAIPLVGAIVRWVAKRRDKEMVNSVADSSGDDPFIAT